MKNMKFWRTALVATLVLTVMLSVTGGTIAWFTDSVTSGENKIQAGNLDVDLFMHNGTEYVEITDAKEPIFGTGSIAQNNNAETLWEPGKTQVAYLKLQNNGNLALKYKASLVVDNVAKDLYKVMEYAIVPDAEAASTPVTAWTSGSTVTEGKQNVSEYVELLPGAIHNFALAIHMQESAGNEYQGGQVNFDLIVEAVQQTYESDSFGPEYDDDAQTGDPEAAKVMTAEALEAAVMAGGKIELGDNIAMTKSINVSNANFELNGNGYTITMTDDAVNTYALFDITGGKAAMKNVTFDGIKGGAIVRTVHAEFNADNVTAKNGNHTQINGLFRLLGKSTITNSTFENNTCNMVISLNWDGANEDPQVIKNCVFENNTCNSTGVLYYVKGAGCTVDGNKFVGNTVNETANSNAATVYMGFTENNVITNNVFMNNTVTTTGTSDRVAGALMIGYEAQISNNAFVGNTVTGTNAKGNDVCASVYYTDIDLSGNYWGGSAPVANDDYYQEYTNHSVSVDDYLTTYPGF